MRRRPRKNGRLGTFRFPRGRREGLTRRRTDLASHFGISEALPKDVREHMLESVQVTTQFPVVVPEHLFVQIAEQVKGFHAHIGSLESALEKTPEVFEPVGMDASVNVSLSVVNGLMNVVPMLQTLIGHERSGVDCASGFNMSANLSLYMMLAPSWNHICANLSAALQNPNDWSFILAASCSNPAIVLLAVHVAGRTADECFVYFYFATVAAEFHQRTVLHRKPDAMQHEPCRFLSHTNGASDFVRTDSVLAVGNHPNRDKPFVETDWRILKNGSDFHAELPMMVDALALPLALILKEHNIIAPASWAGHDAGRPAKPNHEVQIVVGIGEVDDGLLKGVWLFHVSHLSQDYSSRFDLSSILLPLQDPIS